jgi:hypothetical protein
MKRRSLEWLRHGVENNLVNKISVVGEIGEFLVNERRIDLLPQTGALSGDGLAVFEDKFTFCSRSFQGRMIYALVAVEPLYCCYICKYDAISSVYEDEEGQAIVVLKDSLLGN